MTKAAFSILSLVLLFSCASTKNTSNASNSALRFEKTACFGTCPEFVLEVKNDGNAQLSVSRNLELDSGLYTCANCDKKQLEVLLKKAQKIGFSNFKSKYDPGVVDLPSIITRINGQKVINILDGPLSLTEFEKQINEAYINQGIWEKIVK